MRRWFKTNLKQFKAGQNRMAAAKIKGDVEGMYALMNQLLNDCMSVEPTAPKRGGTLRAAHRIKVTQTPTGVEGELTVDLPYAASLHEGLSRWGTPYQKWTEPGSGAHWIISKMLMFDKKYVYILNKSVTGALRMAVRGK